MDKLLTKEPNPAVGRRLTARFFDEQIRYLEAYTTYGRPVGLLPSSSQQQVLPYLDPPDVLRMPAIRAVGVHGFPIIAGPGDSGTGIPPFDTQSLPIGLHQIHACLAIGKSCCGEVVEAPAVQRRGAGGGGHRYREFRKARILLAAGEDRLQHADWLPVAQLDRIRSGGSVRTELDPHFHPPVTTMCAYCHPNPLTRLVGTALAGLEIDCGSDPPDNLRIELGLLRNIAETGTPEAVFIQTQRCLALLRSFKDSPIVLDGRLENFRYSSDSFGAFLAQLRESLYEQAKRKELLPEVLEINSINFLKLPGELVEEEDFWTWTPPRADFVASGMAIYFPRAAAGSLPVIQYGLRKTEQHGFSVARDAERFSGPGTVVLMDQLQSNVGQIYLTVDSARLTQRLRKNIGDEYALYYY